MQSDRITIIIDQQEQQPWSFQGRADVTRGHLETGDYALEGDNGFAVERKSLDDYTGTVSSGWARFKRELERMDEMFFPAKVVIVEADWIKVIEHAYNHPEVDPPFILKRTAELIYRGISVVFCSNPVAAAGLCWRVLYERHQHLKEMEKANGNDHSNA